MMAKAKILVVEDELDLGGIIQKCLEHSGFEVTGLTPTGVGALEMARASSPDLVLMDIALVGEMDGVEAAAKLRFDLNIPVIYLTGLSDEDTLERAKKTEPIGYLLKPFEPQVLLTTIESSLHQYRASIDRAQKNLQHAQDKFLEMFENSTLGMYQIAPLGRLLKANPSMARILGYATPAELLATVPDLETVYEDPSRRRALHRQLRQHGLANNFEARVRRRDGSLIWISVNAHLIRDVEGREQYFEGIVQDITEQKLAVEALRESESRLMCVVNAAQDGIMMIDDQDLVTLWSPAAERITGYTAAEALGKNLHQMLVPSRLQATQNSAFQTRRLTGRDNAIGKTVEVPCLRKDQTEIPVELSLSSVQMNGHWTAVGIIRDITERKKVQMERDGMEVMLRQSQKLESIGQLAAGIAHEINTPTQYVGDNTRFFKDAFGEVQNVLQAYGQLFDACKQGLVPAELLQHVASEVKAADLDYLAAEIPKAIAQTLEGVDRVATIVRAMKDFSHPGTKEKTPTNIHKAIESTLIVCRNEYKYVADVTINFDESMPLVPCFPGDFNQVIMNLIVNAAHAIAGNLPNQLDSKGRITVATRHDGDWAEIRISDTGGGIPEDIRAKIYDPFFTTKEVGKGTGQGLAICHAVVVNKHGGTIAFETKIGAGTTFIIRLPLSGSGQESEAA